MAKYLVKCTATPTCPVTEVELNIVPVVETCAGCGGWVTVDHENQVIGTCLDSIIDPFTGHCFVTVLLDE